MADEPSVGDDLGDMEFMLLLDAKPDRCEVCAEGLAHQHPDGTLKACQPIRCPGCMLCPRADECD